MATERGGSDNVLIGPDLNTSRPPLDKKLYRQILLPNGLRCVLISDTIAINKAPHGTYFDGGDAATDDDSDDSGDEEHMDVDEESHGHDSMEENSHDDDDETVGSNASDGEDEGLREAAAAMVVGVGSLYDPPEAQGMAHFLEHMLFMGTKKYPTENAFDAYMSKVGGADNAYTECEHTVYHLEIPQEGLFQALDMFAQFFIHPLMLEDSVERELNSIESEFQLSKNSDQCRLQQLMCHTCGQTAERHPFAKFTWGNLESLREMPEKENVNMMELLRKFYNQYYYAQNMRLVVVGAYSLEVLQRNVVKCFSDVPPFPREPSPLQPKIVDERSWGATYESQVTQFGRPFLPTTLRKVFRIVPVRDSHCLILTWQLPSQFHNWRTKPCDYIANLLGHEANGSILSSLKERSWATTLCAGIGGSGLETASSHALFLMTITLSEEGVANYRSIVTEVYRYIGMFRHFAASPDGLPLWIQEELKSIHELSYRYGDEPSSDDLVQELAEELAPHLGMPPERLLDGSELLFDYDPNEIKNLLDYFQPSNMRVDLMSSTFGRACDYDASEDIDESLIGRSRRTAAISEDDGTFDPQNAETPGFEPMFGARYWCRSLPESIIDEWTQVCAPQLPPPDSSLRLPPMNPFVPVDLALKALPPDDSHHPLVHCSLKICITVGKKKTWFPSTVAKYNATENQILLSYEDEEEKWHAVDLPRSQLTAASLVRGFEGTLDGKKIKYRVVALAQDGEGAVMKFGDESDHHVELGTRFPPIPPPTPESRLPKLIHNTQVLKLWHLQDRKFKRPIAELRMRIVCAAANRTAFHRACADLFVSLLLDSITETSYLAECCDLGLSLGSNDSGFSMRVHGYNDKLLDLFQLMGCAIFAFRGRAGQSDLPYSIKGGRFQACLEVLRRRYANDGLKASKLSSDVRLRCLQPFVYSSYAKSQALETVDEVAFSTVISELLAKFSIEAFYHGNVNRSDAGDAKNLILNMVDESGGGAGLPKKKYPKELVTMIPPAHQVQGPANVILPSLDPTEPNSAVEVYFQVGKDNIEERVLIDVLTHIMYEPLYDQLRTRDQFGYSVSCDSRWTNGVMGMHFRVVTSTKSADETAQRIEQFLLDFRQVLIDMPDDDFTEQVVGLAKNKLDMFNSLAEECSSLWGEIRDGRYDFEIHRNEAVCLRSVTRERVLSAYDKWLSPTATAPVDGSPSPNNQRRMLVVEVIGPSDGPASDGRPVVDEMVVREYVDESIRSFQRSVGNETWGKITY